MLKRIVIFLVTIFSLFFITNVTIAQIKIRKVQNQDYTVNIKKIKLSEFVKFVSEFTNTNFVYNPEILRGEISINSPAPMNKQDLLNLFYTVLRANNLIAIHKKDYIQILRMGAARQYQDHFKKNIVSNKEDIITTIIGLHHLSATVISRTLLQLKSNIGQVIPVIGLNMIVIRDTTSRIKKMLDIIHQLEAVSSNYKFITVVINNIPASDVARNLMQFYSKLRANSLVGTIPVIVPDDYSNTLIIAALPDEIDQIKKIVASIDRPAKSVHNIPQVIYLKNSDASDVAQVLQRLIPSLSYHKRGEPRPIGSITFDKATNSIIVIGSKKFDQEIAEFIKKIDIPRKQVFVQALIIETTLNKSSAFGVEWMAGGGNKNFAATATFLNTNSALNSFEGPILSGNSPNFGALTGGFNIGVLGNIITYEGVKFPTLSSLVSFLKTASGINILSNPQIITLDNQEAQIFVGENRPFITSTKYDANNNPIQTFDYRDVGIKFKITPHISSDDTITLKIYIEVKKVIANASANVPAPITLTRTTQTMVKLRDGSTMVISGLIKNDTSNNNSVVPILSKIPVIGWLFRYKKNSGEKTNLMVFISTRIIKTAKQADTLTNKKQKSSKMFRENIQTEIKKEY